MTIYHHNNLKNDLLEYGLKMISKEGIEKKCAGMVLTLF